jgi:hypothetical protein
MPSENASRTEPNLDAILIQFGRRVLQETVFDRIGEGLDALHSRRFQELDVLGPTEPPTIPDTANDVLRDPLHRLRQLAPDGPLIVVREGAQNTVIDVSALLLHSNADLRASAVHYLISADAVERPWLTPETLRVLREREFALSSQDQPSWRSAGIEVIPVIRDDLFAHVAGLQQSWAFDLQDSANNYLRRVMRPSLRTLAHLRPDTWSPTEQAEEIDQWVEKASRKDSLTDAMTSYFDKCGYLPLCRKMGIAEVVRQWLVRNPKHSLQWSDIASWAGNRPIARYHACIVAVHHWAELAAEDVTQCGAWVSELMDVREDLINASPAQMRWYLYVNLALHFSQHVESLHPGQSGERIACYAWWLAMLVGDLVASVEKSIQPFIEHVLLPENSLSLLRWTVARSPMIPSRLWFSTRFTNSVWSLSFLRQFASATASVAPAVIPKELRSPVANSLRGFVVASPLLCPAPPLPIFAFEDDADILDLTKVEYFSGDDETEVMTLCAEFRRELYDPSVMRRRLDCLLELQAYEQHLTALTLQEIVLSSNKCDHVLQDWAVDTNIVTRVMHELPDHSLNPLLEALVEFHLRPNEKSLVRVPHLLAYAMEQCDDLDRVERLNVYTIQMSINAGIASPIVRVLTSKWRSALSSRIALWRDNLLEVAMASEPWVGARIRASSAAISRVIGPSKRNTGVRID